MRGFTEIHAHFVYGVDDGAQTRAEMEAMLDAAYADGVDALFATPHVTPGVRPFDREAFEAHFEEARTYCRQQGYSMRLYRGAEVLYTPVLAQYAVDHRLPTLADTRAVLIEFAPGIGLHEVDQALETLERAGYDPVLAHIERYACLFAGNNAAGLKRRHAVRYQVNAHTLLKGQGFFRNRKLRSWLRAGLVDHVASDAHDVRNRPFQISKAYRLLTQWCGEAEAGRLTGLEPGAPS